ncbi:MAG: hypothetical protein ACYSW4_02120 [Planctomycetota bacterium]|jgi:hypothetical protein
MAKHKTGLHKEIASIFDGVPAQKKKGAQQASHTPTPKRPGYEGHQQHNKGRLGTSVAPRPPAPAAPAPKIPETPKYQQPKPLLPKAAPPEQPKVDTRPESGTLTSWQQTYQQIKDKLFAPQPGVNAGRQKAMTMLVPVLFIILIFVFVKVLAPSASRTHASTGPGPSNAVAGSDNKIDWQIPAPYPITLRDPMQFSSVTTVSNGTETKTPELIVKAIVYSEDNPSAVVGKQIVHEGDEISGATVVKIDKDGVEFEMNGKRWKQKVQ